MSYRNPQIIVDKSAEIIAQGLDKFNQSMVKGVNNYIKAQSAVNSFSLNLLSEAQDEVTDAASRLKGEAFQKQFTDQMMSKYKEVIDAQTKLKFSPGKVSEEDLLNLSREKVKIKTAIEAAKSFGGNLGADLLSLKNNPIGTSGDKMTIRGSFKNNEKFKNLLFLDANSETSGVTGVTHAKTLKNGSWTIESTVDLSDPLIKSYIDQGLIDVDSLSIGKDNKATIKNSGKVGEYTSVLIDVPSQIDSTEALVNGGIVGKNGKINETLFDTEFNQYGSGIKDTKTREKKSYITKDQISNNIVLNNFLDEKIEGILSRPLTQQLEFYNTLSNSEDYSFKEWRTLDKDKRKTIIKDKELNKAINRVTGGLFTDGEGKYYKTKKDLIEVKKPKVTVDPNAAVTAEAKKQAESFYSNLMKDPVSTLKGYADTGVSDVSKEGDIVSFSTYDNEREKLPVENYDLSKKSDKKALALRIAKTIPWAKGSSKDVREFMKALDNMTEETVKGKYNNIFK